MNITFLDEDFGKRVKAIQRRHQRGSILKKALLGLGLLALAVMGFLMVNRALDTRMDKQTEYSPSLMSPSNVAAVVSNAHRLIVTNK